MGDKRFQIQCPPFTEGLEIAFELNHALRAHVLSSQKATMAMIDQLPAEQKAALEGAETPADREKIWLEQIAPKMDKSSLLQAAADFLHQLKPREMVAMAFSLFKYTTINGKSMADESVLMTEMSGNYKIVVPLMAAIIEQNDFLDLDASELLQVNQ